MFVRSLLHPKLLVCSLSTSDKENKILLSKPTRLPNFTEQKISILAERTRFCAPLFPVLFEYSATP